MPITESDFEKLAECLAEFAVTGDNAENLQQVKAAFITPEVERYLLHGLLGAGAGVGLGALQPEKKKRNILYYGALGGLGGLGLAKLTDSGAPPAPNHKHPDLSTLQKMRLKSILTAKMEDKDKYQKLLSMAPAVDKK